MEYKDYVKELKDKCDVFLQQVEYMGNENAYTDRLLENIFESVARLKDFYYKSDNNMVEDEVKVVRSMDELRNYLEEKGWWVTECSYVGGRAGWEIGQHSPAGEDFSFPFEHDNNLEEAIKEIKRYADDFDIDEHVKMWVEAQGRVSGIPDTVTLVEDAKAIQEMLDELADGVNWCEQKTIAETLAEAQEKAEEIISKNEKNKYYKFSDGMFSYYVNKDTGAKKLKLEEGDVEVDADLDDFMPGH